MFTFPLGRWTTEQLDSGRLLQKAQHISLSRSQGFLTATYLPRYLARINFPIFITPGYFREAPLLLYSIKVQFLISSTFPNIEQEDKLEPTKSTFCDICFR